MSELSMFVYHTPAPHVLNTSGIDLKWDKALKNHVLLRVKKINVHKVLVKRLVDCGEIPEDISYDEQFNSVHEIFEAAVIELFDEAPSRKDFTLETIAGVTYILSGGIGTGMYPPETTRLIRIFNTFDGGFFSKGL